MKKIFKKFESNWQKVIVFWIILLMKHFNIFLLVIFLNFIHLVLFVVVLGILTTIVLPNDGIMNIYIDTLMWLVVMDALTLTVISIILVVGPILTLVNNRLVMTILILPHLLA